MTPKRCLGRSEILWVVSAFIFLLVARCLSHEAEPHTIGSNGFRKRNVYGLRGRESHTSGEGWIRGDGFWRGLCYSPLRSFFTGLEGTFGVRCRHTGCAPSRGPTALQWRGDVSSLGFGRRYCHSFWAHCGDNREVVAWRLL